MLVCVTLARDIECFQIKIERTPSLQLCSLEESWPQSKEIRGRHHQRIESFSAARRIKGVIHRTDPKLAVPVMGRHEFSSCARRNGGIQGPFRHKERAIIGFDFIERIVRCHLLKEGVPELEARAPRHHDLGRSALFRQTANIGFPTDQSGKGNTWLSNSSPKSNPGRPVGAAAYRGSDQSSLAPSQQEDTASIEAGVGSQKLHRGDAIGYLARICRVLKQAVAFAASTEIDTKTGKPKGCERPGYVGENSFALAWNLKLIANSTKPREKQDHRLWFPGSKAQRADNTLSLNVKGYDLLWRFVTVAVLWQFPPPRYNQTRS